MEDIPKGPDTFFRLSPAGSGEARYFAVRRGDVNQVANVAVLLSEHYGDLKALALCQYPLGSVGDMLSVVQDGLHGVRNYVADGVPLLGVGNVTEEGLDLSEVKRITFEEHKRLAASQVAYGDLLVTITGRLGTAAIYDSVEPANLSAHVALCRAKPQHELRYLQHYLASRLGAASLTKATIGSTHPHINVNRLVELPIPLPSRPEQREISDKMDAARVEHKAKLAEADALLTGLDDFVLETLGLKSRTSQKAFFAARATDILSSRFDPDFHSLRFRTIRNGIEKGRYPAKSLVELCEHLIAGFAAGRQNQAFEYESGVPHLRPLNLDIFGQLSLEGTKFVPRTSVTEGNRCVRGEVLFNNTNSTEMVGKSAVFDLEQPCACSNHMTRLKPHNGVNPEYLVAVFNALRRLGYLGLLSTNFNNQAGINAETLKQLRLPQPPTSEQEYIAAEIHRRRDESHRLRAEAESDWQAAKRWFEEQLLGPTSS